MLSCTVTQRDRRCCFFSFPNADLPFNDLSYWVLGWPRTLQTRLTSNSQRSLYPCASASQVLGSKACANTPSSELGFVGFLNIYLYLFYVECFAHMYICMPRAHLVCTGHKRLSDLLELEKQTIVSCRMGVGNHTQVLWKSRQLLTTEPSLQPWVRVVFKTYCIVL